MEANYNLRAITFALAALVSAVPATASTDDGPRVAVSYGDLDLTSEAGIETLDRRLDRAVKRVCGSASITELQAQRQIKECRAITWNAVRSERDFAIARAADRQLARATRTSQTVVAHAE